MDEAYDLLLDFATHQPIDHWYGSESDVLRYSGQPQGTQVYSSSSYPSSSFRKSKLIITLGLVHGPCLDHLLEDAGVGTNINADQSSNGAYSNVALEFHSLVVNQWPKPRSGHHIYGPEPGLLIWKGMQRSRIPSTLERGISLGRRKDLQRKEGRVCGSGMEAICVCIWIWSGSTGLAAAADR